MSGTPSFFKNIPGTESSETQEVLNSPFTDGPDNDKPSQVEEKPDQQTQTETDKPKQEDKKEEPKAPNTENKEGDKKTDVKKEEPKKEEAKVEEKKSEENKQPEQPAAPPKKVTFAGKQFNSIEDAEKSYKEMQGMYSRLMGSIRKDGVNIQGDDEFAKNIEYLKKTPLVNFQLPKTDDYKTDEGNFDLNKYMNDTVQSIVLGLQQSLLGGPLAAAQFTMLSRAVEEHHHSQIETSRRENEAAQTLNKLTTEFPILSTNEDVQNDYEAMIMGEKARRQRNAEASGKAPEPLTFDDYRKMLVRVIGRMEVKTEPQVEDKVETTKTTPTLNLDNTQPPSDEEAAIEGMMGVKKRGIF